ncbi:branched-chain-amino-acid aminotransferase-like protein 1-like [Trifolium medium]|uniref:Branched-chain-amino-acid aminotransferase-like protein 1-like n=1 Tax=Trifolium medium TaxID=97028 RepID=A0A392LX43_9FABA|nr:branched-chain-amino-acid aminotransferase-like protein 1-like [Trifolium medium]
MLSWEAGPKPIDGLWAPWWYTNVHKSTCFKEQRKYPSEPFPFSLYDLLEQSLPLYNMLRRHVKRKSSLLSSPLPPPILPVPANGKLLVWVGDEIVTREMAKVSVLDSAVQGGDSVWEDLQVHNKKIFKLEEHLDRMLDSAKALAFENVPTRAEVTAGMSPKLNLYGCTLIVLAEWNPPILDNEHCIVLVTSPTTLLNPLYVQANNAEADDVIVLDRDGYVSGTNTANIFMVERGRVLTPSVDYCLPSITRATVINLVMKEGFILEERRIALSVVRHADEVWTIGPTGELIPVIKVDGYTIGNGKVGPVTRKLQAAYEELTGGQGVPIPIPIYP